VSGRLWGFYVSSAWKTLRVRDVADIFDGPHATPRKTSSGPWFLSISSLQSGHLALSESSHVDEDDFRRWTRRVTPQEGDVLFSYETRLGEAAFMPAGVTGCLGRRMGLLRPKAINPRFLLYAYLGPEFQKEIDRRAVRGATVDRIPLNEMGSWPIRIPSRLTQDAIAEVLGALDDKIDANGQLAECVLDSAVAVYLEGVSTGNARRVKFKDVGRWLSGGTPSTTESRYWGGELPWISAASLKSFFIDTSDRRLTPEGAMAGTRVVPAGAVIFVVRGMSLKTEFRIGVAQREVAFGQDCKAVVVQDGYPPCTVAVGLHTARDRVLELVDEAGHGTGRLATDRIEQLELPLPSAERSPVVEECIAALLARGAAAEEESRRLSALRDALLPPLMSGALSVRDAVELVGQAV
jgi:type I restriction enzyme S subunit